MTVTAGKGVVYMDPSGGTGSGGGMYSSLSNWRAGGIQGKKVVFCGDSTTAQIQQNTAGVLDTFNLRHVTEPNSLLNGVNVQFIGSNGATALVFLQDGVPGASISAVIAAAPDLIVYSYGINDVRLGTNTQAQFQALLVQTVQALTTALPNVDIVLRVPNSFLSTDVNGNGYVVPNSSAQDYTTRLRGAYLAMQNTFPNVTVWDSQLDIFSPVILASSLYMVDQLHPNGAGYVAILDELAAYLGSTEQYNAGRAADAQNVNYGAAHTIYPLIVAGPDYQLITDGWFVGNGNGYIDFGGDTGKVATITVGDVISQNGTHAFALTDGQSASISGSNIRMLLGGGSPAYLQSGGRVGVYRQKYANISGAKAILNDSKYTVVRRCVIYGSGTNYIILGPMLGEPGLSAWNIKSTDYLLHPALGLISLSGAGAALQGSNLTIQMTGNFTTTAKYCYLLATDTMRVGTQVPLPIELNMFGTLNATPLPLFAKHGGEYRNWFAKLGTAGSTNTVAVISVAGVDVITLTFVGGSQFATVSWPANPLVILNYTDISLRLTSVGTGAKDLSIVLDV